MSGPQHRVELEGLAADLSEACALLSASVVRATAETSLRAEIDVEARLYAAAVVIWSIRRPETPPDAEALLDVWLADYLADMHDEDRAIFLRALDKRVAQYVVLWEGGGDWALNTARFLDVNMRIEADAATLSALAGAAATGRDGIDKFVQAAFRA